MPKVRRPRRLLGLMLPLLATIMAASPARAPRAPAAAAFPIEQPTLAWSCGPHPVYVGPLRPAATIAARAVLAELESATGHSWPWTDDAAAADVVIRWGVPLRVHATSEVW